MLVKIVIAGIVLAMVLAGGAIVKNGVPLLEAPGLGKRLLIYLSRNQAQTRPDHELPELRTLSYPFSGDELFSRVVRAVHQIGWEILEEDHDQRKIHAVVATPWLRFKDDVRVTLEETGAGQTRLHVTSRSRVGRADYGANINHIVTLHRKLRTEP